MGLKQDMTTLSIEQLLNAAVLKVDVHQQYDRELAALSFWKSNKHLKHTNMKKLTQAEVAIKFKITPKRLGNLIKDPSKVGNTAGPPLRLSVDLEKHLVDFICFKAQCLVPISMDEVINQADAIRKLKSGQVNMDLGI